MLLLINIFEEIFLYLDITTLVHLTQTCKDLFRLYYSDHLWSKKYLHEFRENINSDKIAKELNLTPRQTYIRRYTQEGGVTYGSESFISLDKLFPKVILSQNNLLIEYYLKIYHYMLKKWFSNDHYIALYHVVDWYELIRATLITQRHDLAFLFHEDLIKSYNACHDLANKFEFNRTFIIDVIVDNLKKGDNLFSSYYCKRNTKKADIKYIPFFLEGYILSKRYINAEILFEHILCENIYCIDECIKHIIRAGDKYFINYITKSHSMFFTFDTMIKGVKGVELISGLKISRSKELPTQITPQDCINLIKQDPRQIDNPKFRFPFQEEIISYLEGVGLTKEKIWHKSRDYILASPQLIKRYYSFFNQRVLMDIVKSFSHCDIKQVYNWCEILLFPVETNNNKLLLKLYQGGYKDLWLIGYRQSDQTFTDSFNFSPYFTMPLDMFFILERNRKQ